MVKKSLLENKKMLVAIIGTATIGVVGATVFGIYKNNEIKEAATQQEVVVDNDTLLNDKSGQETIDVDALAETYYNENKDNIKSDTTLEDWTTVFKDYWATTNGDESATVRDCLNYFAPDTILPGDVEDPESMEVKVDEEDAALVTAEMLGNDDATEEEIVSIEAAEATSEASITDANTDTVTQNTHEYEIEYRDTAETMYAVKGVNVRKGPATDYDKVKVLKVNEKIEVIGIVSEVDDEETYWVVYKDKDGNELFVSGAYVDTKPIAQTSSSSGSGNTSSNNNTSNNNTSNNNTQSSGSQQQSSGSGNQSMIDKLRNTKSTTDYSTSGSADDAAGTVGQTGINWQ